LFFFLIIWPPFPSQAAPSNPSNTLGDQLLQAGTAPVTSAHGAPQGEETMSDSEASEGEKKKKKKKTKSKSKTKKSA